MRLTLQGIGKTYELDGGTRIPALCDVTLTIASGEFVALMGPSGCGKFTLLTILGLLMRPSAGQYLVDGRDAQSLTRHAQDALRGQSIGFVFQAGNLLPREQAWRNVMIPLTFNPAHRKDRKQRALDALRAVRLDHRVNHFPSQMSGGEQQRVGIARALVNSPQLLLADEPTGSLDRRTGEDILALMAELGRARGATIIMATHDSNVASHAGRVIEMCDGKIVSDSRRG